MARLTARVRAQIDADVVVGADGVNSTVARFMDLVDTRDDCQVRMLGGAVVDPDCTRMSTIHPSASTMMVVEQGPAMFIGTYTARSEDGVAAESTGTHALARTVTSCMCVCVVVCACVWLWLWLWLWLCVCVCVAVCVWLCVCPRRW